MAEQTFSGTISADLYAALTCRALLALCAAHRRPQSSCKRLRCFVSLCTSERSLFMLKAGSLHVHFAIRPHPAAVPGRRPDNFRIQARVWNCPVRVESRLSSIEERVKDSQIAEYAVACVVTLALSLGLLLCDARPSTARSSITGALLQQDVVNGELQLHYHKCCTQL